MYSKVNLNKDNVNNYNTQIICTKFEDLFKKVGNSGGELYQALQAPKTVHQDQILNLLTNTCLLYADKFFEESTRKDTKFFEFFNNAIKHTNALAQSAWIFCNFDTIVASFKELAYLTIFYTCFCFLQKKIFRQELQTLYITNIMYLLKQSDGCQKLLCNSAEWYMLINSQTPILNIEESTPPSFDNKIKPQIYELETLTTTYKTLSNIFHHLQKNELLQLINSLTKPDQQIFKYAYALLKQIK